MDNDEKGKAIKLIIDSRLEDVFLVGLATRAICAYAPLKELTVYQIELCVVEAVNNVIKHAYGGRSGDNVEVKISLFLDRITIEVRDTGRSMDSGRLAERRRLEFDPSNLETVPEGGMGLNIMQKVMDEVAYTRMGEKNILTMTKLLEND